MPAQCGGDRKIEDDFHKSSRAQRALRLWQHFIMFSTARHAAPRQAGRTCLGNARPAAVSRNATIARLLSTLAVLEQREGKLNMSSLAAVTAGQKLGGSVTGFVAGSNIKQVAEQAAKVEGLEKVLYVENGDYDKGLPENYAPLLVENIKKGEFTHVVAGHSAFGKTLMPRVAALLDVQQISDITAIESEDSTPSIPFSPYQTATY